MSRFEEAGLYWYKSRNAYVSTGLRRFAIERESPRDKYWTLWLIGTGKHDPSKRIATGSAMFCMRTAEIIQILDDGLE